MQGTRGIVLVFRCGALSRAPHTRSALKHLRSERNKGTANIQDTDRSHVCLRAKASSRDPRSAPFLHVSAALLGQEWEPRAQSLPARTSSLRRELLPQGARGTELLFICQSHCERTARLSVFSLLQKVAGFSPQTVFPPLISPLLPSFCRSLEIFPTIGKF